MNNNQDNASQIQSPSATTFCPSCGTAVAGKFCMSCGTKIEVQPLPVVSEQQSVPVQQPVQPVQPVQQMQQAPMQPMMQQVPMAQQAPIGMPQQGVNQVPLMNNGTTPKKSKKALIGIIIAVIAVVVAIVIAVVVISNNKDIEKEEEIKEPEKTESKTEVHEKVKRTIMIYMVGSDLESEHGLATKDINDIDTTKFDFENNNVVMIAGGSKKWYNDYIYEDETAIFELTEDGFQKMEVYDVKNMASSETLSFFLNHAYTYYPAENYELIFWNHGGANLGLELDELHPGTLFESDILSLPELETGLKNSPFNSSNKIETIIFQTCLMGTYEVADIIDEYANYMVSSEEVMYLSQYLEKWPFFAQIEIDDTGLEIGKKFVDTYYYSMLNYNQILIQSGYSSLDLTYSVIDLSKFVTLEQAMSEFFSDIDVSSNYSYIASVRAKLPGYGGDSASVYNTVDLYNMVNSLKSLSPDKGELVLNALKEVVVYNKSLNNYSNGLAIYFPYGGITKFNETTFNDIGAVSGNSTESYFKFITEFDKILTTGYVTSDFDVLGNQGTSKKGSFSLKLTEEQRKNYAHAGVMVFKDMGDGYYMPLYKSTDVTLDKNGNLVAPYNGKALSIVDKEDNSESMVLLVEEEKTSNYTKYSTPVYFQRFDDDTLKTTIDNATLYIMVDKNNPNGVITSIVKKDSNEKLPSMVLLNMEDYEDIYYMNFKYKILDENGNYTTNWESAGVSYLFRTGTDKTDYEYKIANLDNGSKYYAVFAVYDIYNKLSYSKLIPLS